MAALTSADWDQFLRQYPDAHLLQTSTWGDFKARFGWQVERVQVGDTGAQVLFRALPLGLQFAYIPKGPVGPNWNALWPDVHRLCHRKRAVLLKVEPDAWENSGEDTAHLAGSFPGFTASADTIQPRRTVIVSLEGSEEEILARMKQKTRYNIRLAERKGVTVRAASLDEMPLLYRMYAETSVRDGFVIRDEAYYTTLWRSFMERGLAEPLIAEVEGEPAAAVVPFFFAGRAWYLYGMSRGVYRERMPNYLLQWEAMRRARARGCTQYDLWGAPDVFDESDSMWGVFRFKEGLGGQVVRFAGALDYPISPLLYDLYTRVLPRVLNIMRRRGRARTQQEVSL